MKPHEEAFHREVGWNALSWNLEEEFESARAARRTRATGSIYDDDTQYRSNSTRTRSEEHIHEPVYHGYESQRQRTARSRFLRVFVVCSVFGLAALAGYLAYDYSRVPEYSCPPSGKSTVVLELGRKITVAPSNEGEVCTIEGKAILGRSYDGYSWERTTSSTQEFDCEPNGRCSIVLPTNAGSFKLSGYSSSMKQTSQSEIARFLMQATFGPTKAELRLWGTITFRDWVIEQIALPASLHRSYYRRRANPRLGAQVVPGRPRKPCENLSRWHRHAFTSRDIGREFVITSIAGSANATLDVLAVSRVEVPRAYWSTAGSGPFVICSVEEFVGGQVRFGDGNCRQSKNNPALYFSSPPASRLLVFSLDTASMVKLAYEVDGVRVLKLASESELSPCTIPVVGPIYALNPGDGLYYQHDPRLRLVGNTVEAPALGETMEKQFCVLAPKTFLNRKSCVVGGRTCRPPRTRTKYIELSDNNLRKFYIDGGLLVYRIEGLRSDMYGSPCASPRRSRWLKVSCSSGNDNAKLPPDTFASFRDALASSTDPNPLVRDITLPSTAICEGTTVKGATLDVSGACWKNVHPELYNVYDLSWWAEPGGHKIPSKISRPAEFLGHSYLTFPSDHSLSRWLDFRGKLRLLGRFMDKIPFNKFWSSVQTPAMAARFGVTSFEHPDDLLTERCGSPGEVPNNPALGSRFTIGVLSSRDIERSDAATIDTKMNSYNFKTSTWTMSAVHAADQLRQRMAFALSQILVVSETQVQSKENEVFLHYYDIFVRHAFGNFRDILKEVSFSPMMADMLTYLETKSVEYNFRETGREIFPDENYAREIMQLFTIGLHELNNDGTVKVDSRGSPIESYTNEDIVSFSKTWTGFKRQRTRGNIESTRLHDPFNRIDPMTIVPEYRDYFPKMNLFSGHVGDGYPRCVDLPSKVFLRKGATWNYLGQKPYVQYVNDPPTINGNPAAKRVSLDSRSALYEALCRPDRNGKCQFKSHVELGESLACMGAECEVDILRVVKVSNVYYEFVRPPCVSFLFYNNAVKIQDQDAKEAMCANPKELVAAEACCERGSLTASERCEYANERVSFISAEKRCQAQGKDLCDFVPGVTSACSPTGYHWTTGSCKVSVKISNDKGKIAVVHQPGDGPIGTSTTRDMRQSVSESSPNWFRVRWTDNSYPAPENNCKDICPMSESNHCICSITVSETAVFNRMPSREEVLAQLHIGWAPLDSYDFGTYYLLPGSTTEVQGYVRVGSLPFDKNTVFKVTEKGEERLFVNTISMVSLSNGDSFRNPANLINIVENTVRDALYETDAVIDHFFKHPNCPPFIAYRIIQRFVTSNPSTRYVDACATAFAEGSYDGIGSGKYGDLSALIAAVLLDREARNTFLDSDPAHGQMREPLLKVIHVLRSLEITPQNNREIELDNLENTIGEMAHLAPDVFSFFKPEYSPPGPLADAGLVGPEAQLFTAPKVISLLNGFLSLTRFGLTDCFSGFGKNHDSRSCDAATLASNAGLRSAPAMLGWTPDVPSIESTVSELSLLLTANRLDKSARGWIEDQMREERIAAGLEQAILVAKQMMIAAPEFHVSNIVQRTTSKAPAPVERNGTRPFKAVVFLMLSGGMDSFNLIVPHSGCKEGKDKYQEYKDIRTDIALPLETLLPIGVPGDKQVCSQFGMHPNLPKLQDLYANGELLFMANIGPLVEPVTKEEVFKNTKEVPVSLFAHNIQQQALQTMFPQVRINTGVMGRMNDALFAQGYSTNAFSIAGYSFALEGEPGISPNQEFIDSSGSPSFDPSDSSRARDGFDELNKNTSRSLYGETWSSAVTSSIIKADKLEQVLNDASLESSWVPRTGYGQQLEQVAKLIKARGELGADRQTFFTAMGGFDSHSDVGGALENKFREINQAIPAFVDEMKEQGVWDDVVFIVGSEFGRTITSNGAGTDHGWGGNYFMLGGKVKGGRFLGEYPHDLSPSGKEYIGRGRILPTTSWDAIWNGVALWFGVSEDRMDVVLPNRGNFAAQLCDASTLFFGGKASSNSNGITLPIILGISIPTGLFAVVLGAFLTKTLLRKFGARSSTGGGQDPPIIRPRLTDTRAGDARPRNPTVQSRSPIIRPGDI